MSASIATASQSARAIEKLQALSLREFSVAKQIATGARPQDIAESLRISIKTVGTYRSRLLQKLGVRSNAEVAVLAYVAGIIDCTI